MSAEVETVERQAQKTEVVIGDFFAYMPTHQFIFSPTGDLWPASSVDGRIKVWPKDPTGKLIRPSHWLDENRPVEQMTWSPDHPQLVRDQVVQSGGWHEHRGTTVYNLYRGPRVEPGNPNDVETWREHLRVLYPDEHVHIERWLAHRVQRPGDKVNHALVLGGAQGIGKDSILEPVKRAVGPWNWSDISPTQMLGRFNGWVKSVVVRVNEARDLGDMDRFKFYDHSKVYIAAPPDVIRVDEKHLRECPVFNVMGVIITTNHKTDGIYLPADDRRHFVAWSEITKETFSERYWREFWRWLHAGGFQNVAAHLRTLDLSDFNPKAPPPKTAAFHAIVQANHAPEDAELGDVFSAMKQPEAVTLTAVITTANEIGLHDLAAEIADRKARRSLTHRFERAGYAPVNNPTAQSGLWVIAGRRQMIYGRRDLAFADQVRAARRLGS